MDRRVRYLLVMTIANGQEIERSFATWQEAEKFCLDRGYLPYSHGKGRQWEYYVFWDKATMSWDRKLSAEWQEVSYDEEE